MSAAGRAAGAAFVALAALQLATEWHGALSVAFVAKALLLPTLAAAYALRGGRDPRLLAFFFGSWVGDVALCLTPLESGEASLLGIPRSDLWFVLGVFAFGAAHLRLIGALRDVDHPERPGPWTTHRAWFLPVVAGGAVAAGLVFPALLQDPARRLAAPVVSTYALVLLSMVMFALQRHGRVPARSFALTFAGAVIFLLSDSLIGLVHLAHLLPAREGAVAIMCTYLLAEVLIAEGMLAQRYAR